MDIYSQIAEKIIAQQETVIGPVAVQQAEQVEGMSVDWANHTVSITGNQKVAIDELIDLYRALFGQIAVDVSKDAVAALTSKLNADELPELLK